MEIKEQLDQMNSAFKEFKTAQEAGDEAKMARINDALDGFEKKMETDRKEFNTAMARTQAFDSNSEAAEVKSEHNEALRTLLTGGNFEAKAAVLNTVTASEGGIVVPPSLERQVVELMREPSPARMYMNVVSLNTAEYNFPLQTSHANTEWIGEMGVRADTSSPDFGNANIKAHDFYAYTTISQVMLEDSGFDISAWVNDKVAKSFARDENAAFVNGDGNGKPNGLVSYVDLAGTGEEGIQTIKPIDLVGASVTADELFDIVNDIKAHYETGACWVMNRATLRDIRKLTDANGNYLFEYAAQMGGSGKIRTLLDYPVYVDDSVAPLAAGDVSMYFGDMKGYTIFDRQGMSQFSEPFTRAGFVKTYTRKRVGGGLEDGQGIRAIRRGV